MTHEELKQAAMECLKKAFTGTDTVPAHIAQAAVAIVLTPEVA